MNISRCLLIRLWIVAQLTVPVLAATTSELTQHGITWNFSTPVEFGKFVTGDYYVIDPGGGVIVSSVTPNPESGLNGSMLNPKPVSGPSNQGYDSRIAYFSEQARVVFPATLPAGSSLVSTISLTSGDLKSTGTSYQAAWSGASVGAAHVALKTAAVLTVLSSPPPAGTFRPPFVGSAKPLYTVSQIQKRFLPALAPPAAAPSRSVAFYERGLERPWLMHGYDWQARVMHPLENMFNYHQQIGEFLSEASMILMTSLATDTLRDRFIQAGIDTYHTMILGKADSAFFEWQVIYTGLLLGRADMANAIRSGVKMEGRATEKFYFWDTRTSTVPGSAGVVSGKTWSGANVFFRKQYGIEEHEHLHPSEWAKATTSTTATNGGVKAEKYRQANDSHPHMGMFLSSRILGAHSHWKSGAPDAYLERWMTEDWSARASTINQYWSGVPNNTRNMGSTFMNQMWNLYKDTTASGSGSQDGLVVTPRDLKVVP
jgi:hypothetical protein